MQGDDKVDDKRDDRLVNGVDAALGAMCKAMEVVIAAGLAVMVVLVFGNVVLRYGFNSGITVSEELSRWMFVWITLLGAIVALRDHGHLGVDMVVNLLPAWGKKACLIASHLAMLGLLGILFKGGWEQVAINWDSAAPSTGLSLAWVHIPALIFAVCAGALLLLDLFKIITGRVADDQLVMVQESEEAGQLRQVLADADEASHGKGAP